MSNEPTSLKTDFSPGKIETTLVLLRISRLNLSTIFVLLILFQSCLGNWKKAIAWSRFSSSHSTSFGAALKDQFYRQDFTQPPEVLY
jgi:hypothetical protein